MPTVRPAPELVYIQLPVQGCSVICGRICRSASQMRHLPDASRHIEYWRRRIALRAESPILAAAHVVFTNIVFAGEGTFKVPGTLMNRGTLRAATLSVVHAGSHFSLVFHYGTKRSTNLNRQCTIVTNIFLLLIWEINQTNRQRYFKTGKFIQSYLRLKRFCLKNEYDVTAPPEKPQFHWSNADTLDGPNHLNSNQTRRIVSRIFLSWNPAIFVG